ncbi:amidase signature domain-containing protein [Aspergillus stella-maris]|uniref:amidase signature domain-containing protein n=1 Tax=Aspergillus stella-maris TaxID=1810926 RepID=UPI003CCD8BB1
MPSLKDLVRASVSLTAIGSGSSGPESVVLTSPNSGNQFVGHFSGSTSSLDVANYGCKLPEDISLSVPLTVFTSSEKTATCAGLKGQVKSYKEYDDVFEELFLKAVYVHGSEKLEAGLLSCLREAYGTEILFSNVKNNETVVVTSTGANNISNGPYLAQVTESKALLGPVYRIHYDENMAFMNGLLPNGTNGTFQYATVNTISDSTIGIPVPSRLYSKEATTVEKPLAGVRVAVKDIIDLKGVKTSNGNRAWFKLYDAVNASAPAMQRLIDLGVSMIGKTKTAQFANSDRPTADWVDYHDAFNPRGDGYQDPGVSSAGSGAATASYDWVDVAIGTDTGGSIRIPAGKNGVFGLRPSFGALSNEGVMEEGEFFDAVGFHTRSPYTLQSFGKTWLSASKQLTTKYDSFPRKIIVPTNLWPVANNASQAVFDEWIDKLATFLNATIEESSIDTYWNATAHRDHPNTDFWSFMQMVGFNLIWRNQLQKVIQPFRTAYAATFGGRTPFINPFPLARYESAANVTQEDSDIAYSRFTYFKSWFGTNVVKPDSSSCSESLFVIPMATGDTVYRNNIYSPPDVSSWASFTPYYFSVQSQGPEVTLPIGEVEYLSDITDVEERLPVAIDLLAHRNCDLMLLDLVGGLADAEVLREVKTGRALW